MENFIIKSVCSLAIFLSFIAIFMTNNFYVFVFSYVVVAICFFFIVPNFLEDILVSLKLKRKESSFDFKI